MRAKLFTIGAGISLLLLIAVAGLWVRSYWVRDLFTYTAASGAAAARGHAVQITALCSHGGFSFQGVRFTVTTPTQMQTLPPFRKRHGIRRETTTLSSLLRYPVILDNKLGRMGDWLGLGIMYYAEDPGPSAPDYTTARALYCTFPSWFLAMLFAILPALRLRRWRIDRKLNRPGFCKTCGYDLRATPDRCPECGTAVPAPAPQTAPPAV
jgi:hypothetical protein